MRLNSALSQGFGKLQHVAPVEVIGLEALWQGGEQLGADPQQARLTQQRHGRRCVCSSSPPVMDATLDVEE